MWAPDQGLDSAWPPDEVRWTSSPWRCVRRALRDKRVSRDAAELMAVLGLTLTQPTGETSIASLAELAAAQALSIEAGIEAMFELERPGALRWDPERHEVEMAGKASLHRDESDHS